MMMSADSNRPGARRLLPLIEPSAADGEACSTCRSNDWIWDEEVELVRRMNRVKQKVREAHAGGDDVRVAELRDEFNELRSKMERVRRARLDSLGHVDYD